MQIKTFLFLGLALAIFGCNNSESAQDKEVELRKVELSTNYGTITIALYNETPIHRDNFIKVAADGVLDSLLFHRVIASFVVQSGDTDSKNAVAGQKLGDGGLPYLMDAEINPELFHKRGAVGMARDDHPLKASHSTQFYIVQGKVANDSLIEIAHKRINEWRAKTEFLLLPENEEIKDQMVWAFQKDTAQFNQLNDSINQIAAEFTDFTQYSIPKKHLDVYKSLGGIPHLDQNYTVFGEVVQGMNIVDSIAAIQTDTNDRPVEDIRILKANYLHD